MLIKSLFFVFLLLLVTGMAYPQLPVSKDVNKLYSLLAKSKTDTNRVNLLIKICRFDNALSAENPVLLDSTLVIATRAKSLAEQIGYKEGVGLSYQVLAQAWCNRKSFGKSNELIKKALGIFLENKYYRDAAECYLNQEEFYQSAGGKDMKVRIAFYEQAQPLFHQDGAIEREAATLERLGDFYQVLQNFDRSLAVLNQALTAYKSVHYPNLQFTYDLLGYVNMQIGHYQEALRYGLLAEKTAFARKDTSSLLCTIYCRLGSTYFLINKVEEADIYFKKALKIAEHFHDRSAIRISMQALFAVLSNERKYHEALTLLNKTIKNYPSKDTAEITMERADFIRAYSGMKNYRKAEPYADTLLRDGLVSQGTTTMVYALSEMVEYFIKSGQYARAAQYTGVLKAGADKFTMKRNQYKTYLFKFKIDSAQKNYLPAIENFRRYTFMKDSLYDLAKTKQLEELKIQYETEQKEHNINYLEKNNLLQQQSIKRADYIRNITVAGSLILLLLLGLLYKSFRLNKQSSKAIERKNIALNQLVTEKEWLLKEIHHRVKNNLQIVTGLLQRQSAYIDNDEALAAIQNSENRMHAISLIHQKLYQSENLDLISMPEYIDELVSFLKESGGLDKRIIFEKHLEEIRLDVAQAVPLGLILNEAVTNAIKYAYSPEEAGTIYITLVHEGPYSQLIIADNGPGMPADLDLQQVDSLGLNLMRGLVKQLDGNLEISNEQGCTININFKTEFFSKKEIRG
jgi:two-component sensor histidine kinase